MVEANNAAINRALRAERRAERAEGRAELAEACFTALGAKLDDMELHDDTGDPRDEGYMAAITEIREWLSQ
jgi:hypothetical protein